MDTRDEEFLKKRQEFLKKKQLEEISAKNITNAMRSTEELRTKIYSQGEIGSQGYAVLLGSISFFFCLYTMTKNFKATFPKGYEFFSKTHLTKIIVFMISFRIGLNIEQSIFEKGVDPVGVKEYISMFNYTESLKQKRLESLSYAERFKIVTDCDIERYAQKVKEYLSNSKG